MDDLTHIYVCKVFYEALFALQILRPQITRFWYAENAPNWAMQKPKIIFFPEIFCENEPLAVFLDTVADIFPN